MGSRAHQGKGAAARWLLTDEGAGVLSDDFKCRHDPSGEARRARSRDRPTARAAGHPPAPRPTGAEQGPVALGSHLGGSPRCCCDRFPGRLACRWAAGCRDAVRSGDDGTARRRDADRPRCRPGGRVRAALALGDAAAPIAHVAAFELARRGVDVPTVDRIDLASAWGLLVFVLGRGVYGLLVIVPDAARRRLRRGTRAPRPGTSTRRGRPVAVWTRRLFCGLARSRSP